MKPNWRASGPAPTLWSPSGPPSRRNGRRWRPSEIGFARPTSRKLELELLKRRLFVAEAERIDTAQLELELGHKLAALDDLARRLSEENDGKAAPPDRSRSRKKPTGRRDLRDADLAEGRIEIVDPALEGVAERIGAEESCKLSWRRPTPIRLVISRIKYRVVEDGTSTVATAPVPPQLSPRCLAAPALLAHIASTSCVMGFHSTARRIGSRAPASVSIAAR